MGQLYDVQPTPTHSDYLAAAQDLLRRQRKRALVIVVTNFRDEDSTELGRRCGCCARAISCCSPACASASSAS